MAYFIPKMKWHPNAVQEIEVFSFFIFIWPTWPDQFLLSCLFKLSSTGFLLTAYVYNDHFRAVGTRSLYLLCFASFQSMRRSGLPTIQMGFNFYKFSVTLPGLLYFYGNYSLPSEFQHTTGSFPHLSLCHLATCIVTLILYLFFSDAFESPRESKLNLCSHFSSPMQAES